MKSRLLASGERFSFSQAYRLLRLLAHREGAQNPSIKVRPNLSLDFPGNDLSEIREVGTAEYRLTANFLGLYGVTSPLPTFYTEDLLDEQHAKAAPGRVARDARAVDASAHDQQVVGRERVVRWRLGRCLHGVTPGKWASNL